MRDPTAPCSAARDTRDRPGRYKAPSGDPYAHNLMDHQNTVPNCFMLDSSLQQEVVKDVVVTKAAFCFLK